MQRVLMCTALLVSTVFSTVRVQACAWDSDTLAAEAKGVPDTVKVIAGRFERNPPQYYEMRLARVTKELQSKPQKLENYDDAGVACDRLHRGDEAIRWMEKKRAQLASLQTKKQISREKYKEHLYRYLANIGTFYAHRWLQNGANRKDLTDMQKGRDYIKAAIALNPDAHFGREKYQLRAMQWVLHPPKMSKDVYWLPVFLHENDYKKPEKAEEGLRGLIVLGTAWESVDVFHALAQMVAYNDNRSYVAELAEMRARELVDEGKNR